MYVLLKIKKKSAFVLKYSETNLVNYVRSYGALENEQELFLEFVKVIANSIKVLYSKQKTHSDIER